MTRTKKTTAPAKTKEIGLGFITELDRYLFGQGTHYKIFEKLGAHPKTYKGKAGMYFAVWAPHAKAVGVVGDFNGWDPDAARTLTLKVRSGFDTVQVGQETPTMEERTRTGSSPKAETAYWEPVTKKV